MPKQSYLVLGTINSQSHTLFGTDHLVHIVWQPFFCKQTFIKITEQSLEIQIIIFYLKI